MTDSAIKTVKVFAGKDGLGYYTAIYGNGEAGPHSEGYGTPDETITHNLRAAEDAARRDFPDAEIVLEPAE